MKASQTLPKPENWQDFENLCKKLWGEIWNCPEIKKNGRTGQEQYGIDISGIPMERNAYYGIQCKGKDEYTKKQLTEKEINIEIEKAKKFEPALEKMYFATTAVKDATIETIFRKKNLEHIKEGLFEVHLYSWEDIVELIFENKSTYDYYLNSNTFKNIQSVRVSFTNGETEMTVRPKFIQKKRISKTNYEKLENQAKKFIQPNLLKNQLLWQEKLWRNHGILDTSSIHSPRGTDYNRSYVDCTILITNDGSEPLEDWKLTLTLSEDIIDATHENSEKKGNYLLPSGNPIHFDTHIDEEKHLIEIEPRKKILVGEDQFNSDPIFLKPLPQNKAINLSWKLVSRNFRQGGILTIKVEPHIEVERIKVDDDSPLLLDEAKQITIEDYIETIDNE